jgi:hypothetical protein
MTATTAGLWLAVVASGMYHGVNPGMGWPLAVSAALMEGGRRPFFVALGALAVGHFLAMTAILIPFAAMASLLEWQRAIRIGAGVIVMAMGGWLLVNRRHPRFLARIPPSRVALWSFLAATAHGAGLMLVPIFLGLAPHGAQGEAAGQHGADMAMSGSGALSLVVAGVHTAAMIIAGGIVAYLVYRWLGLKFLSKSWFNLDIVWASTLILVGAIGVITAL